MPPKIHVFSDVHSEFTPWTYTPPPGGCDVVSMAGDIGCAARIGRIASILEAAAKHAPVVYVPGNHCYYTMSVEAANAKLAALAERLTEECAHPVHFLVGGRTVEIAGAVFWGGTLWSDFCLYGTPEVSMALAERAQVGVMDFRCITVNGAPITARWMAEQHKAELGTLVRADALARARGLPLVAVPHFLPTPGSVHPRWRGDTLSPYFCSNLDWLMAGPRRLKSLRLVHHGHSHDCVDHMVGDVRVVNNAFGYRREQGRNGFNKHLVVEVPGPAAASG